MIHAGAREYAGDDGWGLGEDENWTSVEHGIPESYQPADAAEGLSLGIETVKRSVVQAGRVMANPVVEMQQGASAERVLKSVVTGVPVCILKPVIGVTEAAATTLRGVRNTVDTDRRKELMSKYKTSLR